MNLLNLFRKPSPIPDTDLRDRLVAAEVQLVLLRDLINRAPRREIRSDAKSYKAAKAGTTEALKRELAAKANVPLAQAIEATRSLSRSEGV